MKEIHIGLLILVLLCALIGIPVSAEFVNPGFETGTYTGWTTSGLWHTDPTASAPHTGTYCGQVASQSGANAYISQNLQLGTTTSFWYYSYNTPAYAYIDTTLVGTYTTYGAWTQVVLDTTAYSGSNHTIKLLCTPWAAGYQIDDFTTNAVLGPTFTYNPASGTSPLTVSFTMTSAFHSTNSWDFGDGYWAYDNLYPTHVYNNPGTYNVTLYDGTGAQPTYTHVSHNVTVTSPTGGLSYDVYMIDRDSLVSLNYTSASVYSDSGMTSLISTSTTPIWDSTEDEWYFTLTGLTNGYIYYFNANSTGYYNRTWSDIGGVTGVRAPMIPTGQPTPIPTPTSNGTYLLMVRVYEDSVSNPISNALVRVFGDITVSTIYDRTARTNEYGVAYLYLMNRTYYLDVSDPYYYASHIFVVNKLPTIESMDVWLTYNPQNQQGGAASVTFEVVDDDTGQIITGHPISVDIYQWGSPTVNQTINLRYSDGLATSIMSPGHYVALAIFGDDSYTPTGQSEFTAVSGDVMVVIIHAFSNTVGAPTTPIATYTPVVTPSWSGGGGQPGNLTEGVLNFFMVLFGVNSLTAGMLAALVLCLIVGAAAAHFAGAIGFMMGCVVAFVACVVMGLIPIWVLIAIIVIIAFVWFLYPMISGGGGE